MPSIQLRESPLNDAASEMESLRSVLQGALIAKILSNWAAYQHELQSKRHVLTPKEWFDMPSSASLPE